MEQVTRGPRDAIPPARPADLAHELVVEVADIEAALAVRGCVIGPSGIVPDDIADDVRVAFGGAVAPEHRGGRDAEYKRALGLKPTDPLPKSIGTISGNGKRSKPNGMVADATRRAADRAGGTRLAREEVNGNLTEGRPADN